MSPRNPNSPASVILPVLNEAVYIERCVRSLVENTYPSDKVEVLVIDGGSTDATREIVSRLNTQYPNVNLLNNPGRILAPGINIGIRSARGDVLIRMDGHAEVPPDFIAQNIAVLAEHPEAWCVGGPIESVSETYVGRGIAAAMMCPVGVGNAKYRLGNHEGPVDTILFGAYRKEVFEKIGLIDESLPRTEDDDLHFRIREAGGIFFLSPRIRSKYYVRPSLTKLWRQYYQYGYWRIATIRKHHRPTTLRQLIPLFFVLAWIGAFIADCLLYPSCWSLCTLAALYSLVLLAGAAYVALHQGLGAALPSLVVFPVLHFAYGIGSLVGIWRFVIRRGKGLTPVANTPLSR
jgi:GT2 family glycosyltransferase